MRIAVLGDCTLDVIVRPPQEPMRMGTDVTARIDIGPGGQAANVAVRLARAGATVRLVAPIADDPAGSLLRAHLAREGVDLAPLAAPRTAAVVVLVAAGAERSMLSDRIPVEGELAPALGVAEWIHVSGYVLRESQEAERVIDGIRRSRVPRVSVAGGSYSGWTDAGVAREAINALPTALLVLNRDEASLLAGEHHPSAAAAAAALGTEKRLAIVTDGPRPAAAAGLALSAPVECPPPTAHPVDSTGAGDAATAELLAHLVGAEDASWPPTNGAIESALTAALRAGSRAAESFGAQSA